MVPPLAYTMTDLGLLYAIVFCLFFTTVPCPPEPLSNCVAGILTCWSGLLRAHSGKVLAIVSLRPDVGTVLLLSHFVA